ncbi:MAG: hypothetical protein FWF03_01645 [Defluviitaleaceae bacterium]|nr:hypothetical protein [Defluviitaleaceae bacterium]
MGELSPVVIKQFGVEDMKITRDKANYICETPDGPRLIYKTSDESARIIFQHEIKEYLNGAGFSQTDRYVLSETGEPYVFIGGEYFVMTHCANLRDSNFNNPDDIAGAIKAIAKFHQCARNVPFKEDTEVFRQTVSLNEHYRKQSSELEAVRKRLNRQARLSDFDVLFIKNAGHYSGLIKDAVFAIEKTDYIEKRGKALNENHICHNALKEECLLLPGPGQEEGDFYLTQFSEAAVDLQLNDVARLVRRYVQRAGQEAKPLGFIFETYERTAPLTQSDIGIVKAMLAYPHAFVKIMNLFYSKKRSWTPNALINRMQSVVSEREVYERYIAAV